MSKPPIVFDAANPNELYHLVDGNVRYNISEKSYAMHFRTSWWSGLLQPSLSAIHHPDSLFEQLKRKHNVPGVGTAIQVSSLLLPAIGRHDRTKIPQTRSQIEFGPIDLNSTVGLQPLTTRSDLGPLASKHGVLRVVEALQSSHLFETKRIIAAGHIMSRGSGRPLTIVRH